MFLSESWTAFSETQVHIDAKRKHLLKSCVRHLYYHMRVLSHIMQSFVLLFLACKEKRCRDDIKNSNKRKNSLAIRVRLDKTNFKAALFLYVPLA